jgi:hypothetical protein
MSTTFVAALKTTTIVTTPQVMRICLGAEPVSLPEPFAATLRQHANSRPSPHTGESVIANPWLFAGCRPGKHLGTPNDHDAFTESGHQSARRPQP